MGLTFPTAFVKKQTVEFDDPTISWNTGLYWSHDGTPNDEIGVTEPFPLQSSSSTVHPNEASSFPFAVRIEGAEEPYYDTYETEEFYYTYGVNTTVENKGQAPGTNTVSAQPYYAWFLTGGYDLSNQYHSAPHQESPWTVANEGLYLRLDFEADGWTAYGSGATANYDGPTSPTYDISLSEDIYWTKYNSYIQSGYAVGSFTLSSPKTLKVEVSGLGQDQVTKNYNQGWSVSDWYEAMTVHIYNGSSSTLLCSGKAPEDDRNILPEAEEAMDNFDVQQVKLYSGNNLETIVNYQGKNGGSVDEEKGAPRSSPGEWVNENNRDANGKYVNTNGTGVFASALSPGNYEIRVRASTVDGAYHSGAFYGFTFSFT